MGVPFNKLNERFAIGIDRLPHGDAAYVMNNANLVDGGGVVKLPVPPVDPNAKENTNVTP